ncbi:MAG: hypothetical protein AUJ49_13075 [Desulfovibrionaceae bacterium CG1_02_65_16]|nr:MAG: hypothetical protein AUJ49_13075 [Desulfovibrionaceae bacterium CG1_02_65_16]
MRCLLLLRDALGRLPTAQELHQCGFRVSAAVLTERAEEPGQPKSQALACAAEPPASYGALPATRPPAPPPALSPPPSMLSIIVAVAPAALERSSGSGGA